MKVSPISCFFSCHSPTSSLIMVIILFRLLLKATPWKNLDFLSPSFNHRVFDLCLQNISSLEESSCNSFLHSMIAVESSKLVMPHSNVSNSVSFYLILYCIFPNTSLFHFANEIPHCCTPSITLQSL